MVFIVQPSRTLPACRNGSVWESNPLGALFKPPLGFEDRSPHQRCKHFHCLLYKSRRPERRARVDHCATTPPVRHFCACRGAVVHALHTPYFHGFSECRPPTTAPVLSVAYHVTRDAWHSSSKAA